MPTAGYGLPVVKHSPLSHGHHKGGRRTGRPRETRTHNATVYNCANRPLKDRKGLATSPSSQRHCRASRERRFGSWNILSPSLVAATRSISTGSCRTSGPGRAFVKWHIELRVESVSHSANNGVVRGDGYYNVALDCGLGISLSESLARLDIKNDEPLLVGVQARAAR